MKTGADMSLRKTFFLLFISSALNGCQPVDVETPVPRPIEQSCQASTYDKLKWLRADVLADRDLPKGTRIIQYGMAITMDYSADRLNFVIGKTGRIERIYCG